MKETSRELLACLRGAKSKRGLLLYRGEEELAFLLEWAGREPAAAGTACLERDPSIPELIRECGRCGEVEEKKFGFGTGANRVMVLLHPPKMITRIEKKFYKTESVDLLKKMIGAMGLAFESCYVTSLIKCETSDSFSKPSLMYRNCEEILKKEIACMKPRVVLVMGDIIPLKKIISDHGEVSWFNVEHPITLIKNPELKRSVWNTLKLAMASLADTGGHEIR